MPKLPIGPRARTALRWGVTLVVIGVCLRILARHLDAAAVGRALAGADYRLVAAMAAAHLALFLGVKAWRWQLMLAPVRRIGLGRLYQYCLAGCAVTNLVPARAGSAARVALLHRDGVPVPGSVAVLVVEEICNAVVLGLLCLPLPFLLDLPSKVRVTLAVVTGGAAIALGILAAVGFAGRSRPSGVLRRVADGLAVLRDRRAAAAVLALTVAMWLVDLGQIALAMRAVALPPSYGAVALVLLFVNLTNAVPVTPGQVGLFEAGAAAACVAVGATAEQGVAVGVLYHVMQLVPETVLGLAVLGRGALGGAWRAQAPAQPEPR
ncbi:MAG TPA: lysylphosphatidylglycerol synthase transmembrane domain-containing protein [Anaeromyxobacteraceae bacterium]|nr:lysylphosphatidylglycerol synthase transmembrane domain-containing protein [Anaeromyxobacteraceae bacterium]